MLRRFWFLLLVLIASSLVMAATVHARETPGSVGIECNGVIHAEGDGDQSQGDADKSVPHHHETCHGQVLNVAEAGPVPPSTLAGGLLIIPDGDPADPSSTAHPGLRPPTA